MAVRASVGKAGRAAICGCAALFSLVSCGGGPERGTNGPLTGAEIALIGDSLRARGLVAATTIFQTVALHEPPKTGDADVPSAPRQAEVQLFDGSTGVLRDLLVTLPEGRVALMTERGHGVFPRLTSQDGRDGVRLLSGDSTWIRALRRRGLTPSDVLVAMTGPGVLGIPQEEAGARYARYLPLLRTGPDFVEPPVEGIVGIVDLTNRRVAEVLDADPVQPPLTRDSVRLAPDNEGSMPRASGRPDRSYRVAGTTVSWSGWEFRFDMHPRDGLVLHDLSFGSRGRPPRRILSRAALAEMLVPYGDPSATWAFRSIFDVGEFGIGRTAATLVPDQDLPASADRFDAVLADDRGAPRRRPGVIGLYERDGGLRWRHRDQAKRARELVLRSAATVGNYDYGFSWVFSEDGVVAMEIDLTGQMQVKGVAAADPRFGSMVAGHLSAIVHQHFFNFRLDFDVDGRQNRVREVETATMAIDSLNPHGTGFGVHSAVLERELQAIRDLAPDRGRVWIVENPHRVDSLGGMAGYVIVPGPLPALQAAPAAHLNDHAAFARHALWVTAWNEKERTAAGEFPGQGSSGAGLPAFSSDNQSVADADIVVWYTTGITHLPRPEEWPVMPVSRIRFELRPNHFLTNPLAGKRAQ